VVFRVNGGGVGGGGGAGGGWCEAGGERGGGRGRGVGWGALLLTGVSVNLGGGVPFLGCSRRSTVLLVSGRPFLFCNNPAHDFFSDFCSPPLAGCFLVSFLGSVSSFFWYLASFTSRCLLVLISFAGGEIGIDWSSYSRGPEG